MMYGGFKKVLVVCRHGQRGVRSLSGRAMANGAAIDSFYERHIGPSVQEREEMLQTVGFKSLDELARSIVPAEVLGEGKELEGLPTSACESEALLEIKTISEKNVLKRSMIGYGYYGVKTPSVLVRNILENPNWYTAYTPYQSEISQGRLEMLLNFQTMVSSLTGLEIATCSLLDEGSAAAEAANMAYASFRKKRNKFFVSKNCFAQTISCVQTRAGSMGMEIVIGDVFEFAESEKEILNDYCGALVQYPDAHGSLHGDYQHLADQFHAADMKFCVATDLLACTVAKPPGEFGADIVVGSAQRFGVPMFFGGPHAGFMSAKDELKRLMPGRLIGVSKDSEGNRALRMALQTREQFIRRERATSNICTAQALLANIAAAYAIYHGPDGLKRIAQNIQSTTQGIVAGMKVLGLKPLHESNYFGTLTFESQLSDRICMEACNEGINLFHADGSQSFGVSVDETTSQSDVYALFTAVGRVLETESKVKEAMDIFSATPTESGIVNPRSTTFLEHPVFNKYQSEAEMMRYLSSLERKDITLRESMIPLGSCTMKLNAASELLPITWPKFSDMHPFSPEDQTKGYQELICQLNGWLASLTGFAAVSTQPNSGATGEYAGLLCIKAYHESRGESHRDVCLIPNSAHGTNPASAVMSGMKVVGVKNDAEGNIDWVDMKRKVEQHGSNLAAVMITYPSTYGKFDPGVEKICSLIHDNGGQVYMDGANMNAQLGLCSPGAIGADVCHLNLHKTFAIPHGGGGPGVGTIGVAEHLAPFLPGHAVVPTGGEGRNVSPKVDGQVAASPFGSAGILPISWMFIRMMGSEGMLDCSRVAMLNANYIAKRLEKHYNIRFRGENGQCAHEFILDLSHLKQYGLTETDVAKRLCDYGFHAPTTSWPVHYSLMVEPTESESKAECDRLVNALISIHSEIEEVASGKADKTNNVLVNAPHTAEMIASDSWPYPYSRQKAAFPLPSINNHSKFWPSVSRVDNAAGDKNLVCTCESVESYETHF